MRGPWSSLGRHHWPFGQKRFQVPGGKWRYGLSLAPNRRPGPALTRRPGRRSPGRWLRRAIPSGGRAGPQVGRLAEAAAGGPQRVGDVYQNSAARLRLIEDVGMCKSIRLRTEEPGTPEVVAFLSWAPRSSPTTPRRSSLTRSPTDSRKGGILWQRRTPRHTIRQRVRHLIRDPISHPCRRRSRLCWLGLPRWLGPWSASWPASMPCTGRQHRPRWLRPRLLRSGRSQAR